jgi:hypothetical protein
MAAVPSDLRAQLALGGFGFSPELLECPVALGTVPKNRKLRVLWSFELAGERLASDGVPKDPLVMGNDHD